MNNLTQQQNPSFIERTSTDKPVSVSQYLILPLYFTVGYWLLATVHQIFMGRIVPFISMGNRLFAPANEYLYSPAFYGLVLFCTACIACVTLNRGRPYNFTPSLLLPATKLLLLFYLCNIGYSLLHYELLIGSASYINWNAPLFIYALANYCVLTILKMLIFLTLFAALFRVYSKRFNARIKEKPTIVQTGCIRKVHALLFTLSMNLWVLLVVELIYQMPLFYVVKSTPYSALFPCSVLSLFLLGNLISILLTYHFTRSQFPAELQQLRTKRVLLAALTCIDLQMLVFLLLALAFLLMMPDNWSLYEAPHISNIGLPEILSYSLTAVVLYFFLSRFSVRYCFAAYYPA